MHKQKVLLPNLLSLLYLIYISGATGDNCIAIPISLSDLQRCENNICYINQVANIAIPATKGAQACLQFVPPDGITATESLNITIDHSRVIRSSSYAYYTDDPVSDVKGFCGCPGGVSVDCKSFPNDLQFTDVQYCKDGLHKNSYCPLIQLGGTGTYVVRLGLSLRNRFKIIRLTPGYSLDAGFTFTTSKSSWALEYSGVVSTTTDNPTYNITIVSDTINYKTRGDFIVFDVSQPTEFWLLSSDLVNGINEFQVGKLGYFKSNLTQKADPNLLSAVDVSIEDCAKNRFSLTSSWLYTKDTLRDLTQFQSRRLIPNSNLFDYDWPTRTLGSREDLTSVGGTYETMGNGWIIYSNWDTGAQQSILFIGQTISSDVIPLPSWDRSTNYMTTTFNFPTSSNANIFFYVNKERDLVSYQTGYMKVTTLSGKKFLVGIKDFLTNSGFSNGTTAFNYTSYSKPYLISNGTSLASTSNWFNIFTVKFRFIGMLTYYHTICLYNQYTSSINCDEYTLSVITWPQMENTNITYKDGKCIEEIYSSETGPTKLLLPTYSGVYNMQVQFKNFTVRFEQTVIKPSIKSVVYRDGSVYVTASSTTVPGNCYLGSEPSYFMTTQSIQLLVIPTEYRIDPLPSEYKGPVNIVIQCYNNKAGSGLQLSYSNSTDTDFTPLPFNATETDVYLPNSVLSALVSIINAIPKTSSITEKYRALFIYATFTVIAVILLIFLYYIYKYISFRSLAYKVSSVLRKETLITQPTITPKQRQDEKTSSNDNRNPYLLAQYKDQELRNRRKLNDLI